MLMYNLLEYMNNFPKTFINLWHFCRDEPNATIAGSESFKFKAKITGRTPYADKTKDVEVTVTSKYFSNF